MSFPRYPKYKASGVEWLGEVPEHWETIPLRRTAVESESLFIDGDWIESNDLSDNGIRYLTSGNVGEGYYKEQGQGYISEETFAALKCIEVLPGDVLISRLNLPIGRSCLVPKLGGRIVTCVDNVIMRLDSNFHRRFFVYQLTSKSHFANMENLAKGTTMQRISRSTLGRVRFAIPPLAEQLAIAAFLDRETAKIDELVEAQARLIELLKEKRQAVISHAVTKGLNPHAPMKPSGVEWLGEVPEHWEVWKLRGLSRLESGHTPSRQHPEYWVESECTISWFTLADVSFLRDVRNWLVNDTSQRISKLGMANSAARLLPVGTVILSRTASVGFSGITGIELAVSQDFAAWICGPRLSRFFLLFCLRAMSSEFRRLMMGSTHQTIYMPDIEAFRIPLPPSNEQLAIVTYLESETTRFDTLTAEAQRAIDLLQERRSALISAAVTGQIDVRNAVTLEVA